MPKKRTFEIPYLKPRAITDALRKQVREELPDTNVRRQVENARKLSNNLLLRSRDHGRRSPILGLLGCGRRSLPITSTRTVVPGAVLAIRVARVTPLYTTSTPLAASYTHNGGIPVADVPN